LNADEINGHNLNNTKAIRHFRNKRMEKSENNVNEHEHLRDL
jgi:hypothetical protein